MSTDTKETLGSEEKKKKKNLRPKLSIKIFSVHGKKKEESLRKIQEERRSHVDREEEEEAEGALIEKTTALMISESAIPAFRPNRRRSLSACADFLDTRIALKARGAAPSNDGSGDGGGSGPAGTGDAADGGEETDSDDQLSPLPGSPSRSCLRQRAATISYEGEVLTAGEFARRPRAVSFSPDTVDPPPRNMKYRAWIEARTRIPTINVKHEKHKQKMNQMKKVNMSDFLISRKLPSSGLLGSSSSPFSGGGMMM